MDFEDACKQLVVPKLAGLKGQAEATLGKLREEEAGRLDMPEEEKGVEELIEAVRALHRREMEASEKAVRDVTARVEAHEKEVKEVRIPAGEQVRDMIQQIEEMLGQEDYQRALTAFFAADLECPYVPSGIGEQVEAERARLKSRFARLKRHLKKVSDVLLSEMDDEDIHQEDRPMPPLFYINEKKRVFKHFDFEAKQIVCRSFDPVAPLIPLFSGLGSLSGRIFLFGGKEQDTRQITNKAFEVHWTPNNDMVSLRPINRMIKNRSRHTVACVEEHNCLVLIGGSDEQTPLS